MFKKFLCGVAVATMMMSCGGATTGDKAQDSTAQDSTAQNSAKVEAAAPEAAAPADFEKTGNALLDEALAKYSAAAAEMDKAKSLEEAMGAMAKFGEDFEAWAEKNAAEAEKVDPALQEKFEKEMAKIQKRMEDKLATFMPADK